MPPSKTNITITKLPSVWPDEAELPAIAELYKDFRLFALQSAPKAFAATYEQEVQFSEERWKQRLQNPDAVHFIAMGSRDGRDLGVKELLDSRWLGMIVLVRKMEGTEKTDYHLAEKIPEALEAQGGGADLPHQRVNAKLCFAANALFVDPKVQGNGFGGRLLEACFEYAENEVEAKGVEEAQVEALVDSWNEEAIGLYKKYGFESAETSRYTVDGEDREAVRMLRIV